MLKVTMSWADRETWMPRCPIGIGLFSDFSDPTLSVQMSDLLQGDFLIFIISYLMIELERWRQGSTALHIKIEVRMTVKSHSLVNAYSKYYVILYCIVHRRHRRQAQSCLGLYLHLLFIHDQFRSLFTYRIFWKSSKKSTCEDSLKSFLFLSLEHPGGLDWSPAEWNSTNPKRFFSEPLNPTKE